MPQRKAIRTFTVKDDGEPVLIMPAFINAQETCLAGHANGICELNLIYFRGTEKRLQEYIEFLFGEIKSPKIRIDRVREGSKLAVIMDKGIEGYLIKRRAIENVKIAFNNGYSEWINGLSKSVRQNVRTAYNRLNTDGRMLKMHMVSGGQAHRSEIHRLIDVYIKRHRSRYNLKTSTIKRFYLHHLDFSSRALMNNERALHCVLTIDDEISAFSSGYIDRGKYIVPRLSIDDGFSRYSPGYLLINEAIKAFSENDKVYAIDLSEGTEKYKLDLGGKVYNKLDFEIGRM